MPEAGKSPDGTCAQTTSKGTGMFRRNRFHPRFWQVGLAFTVSLPALAWTQDEFSDCDYCPEMVLVPSGTVTIGSSEHAAYRRPGERPLQTLTIDTAFALGKYEVTVGQYRVFVEATGHKAQPTVVQGRTLAGCNYYDGATYGYVADHSWKSPGYAQREEDPVVCVSWSDAVAYAQWLAGQTGRPYRLPSTSEFEYGLRAGSKTPWFWGTNPDEACEYANIGDRSFRNLFPRRPQFDCEDQYVFTAPVGRFKANGFGLHDMLGNVWEWTQDCWHDDMSGSPLNGSAWLDSGGGDCEFRVPKGGSWISGPGWARASARSKDGRHYRSFMLGFRVAAAVNAAD